MKLVSSAQMRALESCAIASGITSIELMEAAGEDLAAAVQSCCSDSSHISILLGKGNNAGDGLVAARHLFDAGYEVALILTSPPSDFSPEAIINWQRIESESLSVIYWDDHEAKQIISSSRLIVDAILGTGFSGDLSPELEKIIKFVNDCKAYVVSADLPSGLNPDSGKPNETCIKADLTVTFGLPKIGLIMPGASDYVGELAVADIGIPNELVEEANIRINLINYENVALPKRGLKTHKGECGNVGIIAGSLGMIGAGVLAGRAALRSGAGLVSYAIPAGAYEKFDVSASEIMMKPITDNKGCFCAASLPDLLEFATNRDVLAIGPGVGRDDVTVQALLECLTKIQKPIVIDADALFALSSDLSVLQQRSAVTILTPHIGEMSRLINKSTSEIESNRLEVTRDFASKHNVWCVLKGYRSVIAAPDGELWINSTGNPGMATAGSGDALTGVIASLVAQGYSIKDAVCSGVFLHGLSGDIVAANIGEAGMITSDIIEHLPHAMKKTENHHA